MKQVSVSKIGDARVAVELEEPGATGYSWKVIGVEGARVLGEALETAAPEAPGSSNSASFEFELEGVGAPASAVLQLSAPFAPGYGAKVNVDLLSGDVSEF